MENLVLLVNELRKSKTEQQWFEFKHNNYNPEMIGEDISALANGAVLEERPFAYFIWGIQNETHEVIGTSYNLHNLKIHNEEIENWLRGLLSKNIDFQYYEEKIEGQPVGIIKIGKAIGQPATFKKTAYIRVGSYTKKLSDYPSLESRLWKRLHNEDFEEMGSVVDQNAAQVIQKLDCAAYFELTGIVPPSDEAGILHYLSEDGIVRKQDNGLYTITNLGALLLSRHLHEFPSVERKAIRILQYEGINRLTMLREETLDKGYAVGFEETIHYVSALLPSKEVIDGAVRRTETAYPILAIRETIANALIHQDLTVTGAGPTVEIFSNRIEVTNPGTMLVDILRVIDNPPRSRNEKLAALMRRMKLCEEAGSGWDKIAMSCELRQLPSPRIDVYEEGTRVTLYSDVNFSALSAEDRIWACYLHSCTCFVQGEQLTNGSLRKRFGVSDTASGSVSRLIRETVTRGLIKPLQAETSKKYMKYIPFWA